VDRRPARLRPDVQHFHEMLTYWGAAATMDGQGRILLPGDLRGKAKLEGEVMILGQIKYMDVWNRKAIDERVGSFQITDEKLKAISDRARRES